ncbi:MAG: cobalt ABC transporter permease [Gracilibacter sp. BRH_c7a]|nr:MAG: cobalt ABC transporter permease [Gracilibacter sp. BRH_c7a]
MISIDMYAYASKLKDINPMEKLALAFITLCVCLWANSIIISLAVLLIMTWSTIYQGGIPGTVYLKLLLIPMGFLILGVLTIAIEITPQPYEFLGSIYFFNFYLGVSKAGLITATQLFFRALGAVSCLYYLSLNTPMMDVMSALRKLRCPKLLVEMMSLIYRFIFVFIATAETMIIAQSSRLGYSGILSGYRSLGTLISSIFIRSYQQADKIYTSLESRGYDGELNVLEQHKAYSLIGYLKVFGINIFLISLTAII